MSLCSFIVYSVRMSLVRINADKRVIISVSTQRYISSSWYFERMFQQRYSHRMARYRRKFNNFQRRALDLGNWRNFAETNSVAIDMNRQLTIDQFAYFLVLPPPQGTLCVTVHHSNLYKTYVKGSLQFPSLTLFVGRVLHLSIRDLHDVTWSCADNRRLYN